MNIKIIIATHKEYKMPTEKCYMPIQVGKAINKKLEYIGDDTGENISIKNKKYCELTGLYWAWKNMSCDYIGLVHYRRYFRSLIKKKRSKDVFDYIVSNDELQKYLTKYNVILPKKRNYYIETIYSHYMHTMYVEPLDKTEEIIGKYYPEYLKIFKKRMKSTKAHMFNMFIMKKELLDEYCNWLFNILQRLEDIIDDNKYDDFHKRFYGRISEVLLDVWIEKNKIEYMELPVISIEKVNWFKKGLSFLKAKFLNKKYEKSF